MKVCHFGAYNPEHPRNRIIIKGLKKNGVEVFECYDRSSIWLRYPKLLWKYLKTGKYDVIIVGAQGHTSVLLAWLLAKIFRRKLIFDPFISLYDTAVFDRKEVDKKSLKARYYYYLDKLSCALAAVVIIDTKEHAKYFNIEFNVSKNKIYIIYIGADDEVFYTRESNKQNKKKITVEFHGTFIPLQGIEYIVHAAKILEKEEDIIFEIIGKGQTYNQVLELSKKLNVNNVSFIGWLDYENIPKYIERADICLGIFGDTIKARRVIPNKAFEILAMKKPLITGDSPAARKVFKDKENVLLCEMANPESLAEAILMLKEDENLRNRIAENGYMLFKERFCLLEIGKEVKKIIQSLI